MDSEALLVKSVIDECCEVIATEKDRAVRSSSIEIAFKTWAKYNSSEPYRQKEFIEAIANKKESEELVQLSTCLVFHEKGLTAASISQILEALTGEISNLKEALHWLDQSLHSKDERWDLSKVINILAVQIPKLDRPIQPNELYNFCEWIWSDPSNTSHLFSSWLNSGQPDLCQFLADMTAEINNNKALVEIFKTNLPNDYNDQIFIARKCVGFMWFYEVTAASILFSIVKHGHQHAREAAEELLYDPLLLSYGGELRSFIEKQVKNPSKRVSDCACRLIENHNMYLAGLRKAEQLVEFLPAPEHRRAVLMKDRDRNSEIQKKARENSIFSQLVTHQTILYGKKTFYLIHGMDGEKAPSIAQLSEFSYSTEFPRLSIVDPARFNEILTIFRIERKVIE